MTIPLLVPDRPTLDLAQGVGFARGRVHELRGRSRRILAAAAAGAALAQADAEGWRPAAQAIWAQPAWARARPMPQGLRPFVDPARLILAACRKPVDLLWTLEEVLRSGAVAAVVADLPEPPGLTPVRRLQLAAEAGGGRVTAFLLTPDAGPGAPGVESRWAMAPLPGGGWRLDRQRARMAPETAFRLGLADGGGEGAGRLTARPVPTT